MGLYLTGNTTQSSSGTQDARNLTFNGLGNVSVGYSNGSVQISGAGGGGGVAVAAAGGTLTSGTAMFSNGGNVSFGAAGQNITGSYSQTNQNMSLYAVSNSTLGSSSTLLNASSLAFKGLGNVSVGMSAGSVLISGSGGGGGGGGVALYDGTHSISSGTANLQASGALTLSVTNQSLQFSVPATSSLSATGAMSLATSGSTVSIGAPAMSSLSATGGLSLSTTGNTINIGAPATSSLVGTNGINVSASSNTIYFDGSGAGGVVSDWEPFPLQNASLSASQMGQGSVYFLKLQPMANVSASQLLQLASITVTTATNSSHNGTISFGVGIYTANGSTLSLITQSSGTTAYNWNVTRATSATAVSGLRGFTIPINVSMSPGNYWLGLWSSTSRAGAAAYSASNMMFGYASATATASGTAAYTYQGIIGQVANATQGIQEGVGLFGASAALPSSAAMSNITQNLLANVPAPYMAFKNMTW